MAMHYPALSGLIEGLLGIDERNLCGLGVTGTGSVHYLAHGLLDGALAPPVAQRPRSGLTQVLLHCCSLRHGDGYSLTSSQAASNAHRCGASDRVAGALFLGW
jgi:hypothetical protein